MGNFSDAVTLAEQLTKIAKNNLPTTTQMRKIYAQINVIRNMYETQKITEPESIGKGGEPLADSLIGELAYLKVKVVYQCARDKDKKLKNFMMQNGFGFGDKLDFCGYLDTIKTVDDFERFLVFMEALIAYQKYYEGERESESGRK